MIKKRNGYFFVGENGMLSNCVHELSKENLLLLRDCYVQFFGTKKNPKINKNAQSNLIRMPYGDVVYSSEQSNYFWGKNKIYEASMPSLLRAIDTISDEVECQLYILQIRVLV